MAEKLSPSDLFTPREVRDYLREVEKLTNNLRESELRLVSSQQKHDLVVSELEKVQDEVERSHDQIASQIQLISDLKRSNVSLQSQVKLQENDSSSHLRRQIEAKDRQIEELVNVVKHKDYTIETLSNNQLFSAERLEQLQIELRAKTAEMDLLQSKLKKTEKSIENLFLNHTSEGDLMLELEHLKTDNQRLLQLVTNKELVQHIADAHYLPPKGKVKKNADERENWAPTDTVKIMNRASKEPITSEVLQSVLIELNKVWLDREKKTLAKLKQHYKTKVLDLKRQMFMRQPYDSINSQKTISRLRNELKQKNKELKGQQDGKNNKHLPDITHVENTLKLLAELQEENKQLRRSIKILKLKVLTSNNSEEDPKFKQGVGWLGEKVMNESTRMHQVVSGMISDFSASKIDVNQDRLIENIEQIVKEFGGNIESLIDSIR